MYEIAHQNPEMIKVLSYSMEKFGRHFRNYDFAKDGSDIRNLLRDQPQTVTPAETIVRHTFEAKTDSQKRNTEIRHQETKNIQGVGTSAQKTSLCNTMQYGTKKTKNLGV